MTGPQEYYATVGAASTPLAGAEGGTLPGMAPAGVLRKQGSSLVTIAESDIEVFCFITYLDGSVAEWLACSTQAQ